MASSIKGEKGVEHVSDSAGHIALLKSGPATPCRRALTLCQGSVPACRNHLHGKEPGFAKNPDCSLSPWGTVRARYAAIKYETVKIGVTYRVVTVRISNMSRKLLLIPRWSFAILDDDIDIWPISGLRYLSIDWNFIRESFEFWLDRRGRHYARYRADGGTSLARVLHPKREREDQDMTIINNLMDRSGDAAPGAADARGVPQLVVILRDGARRTLAASAGLSVMEIIRDAGIDELPAYCGGCCSCATCHVDVSAPWFGRLPAMSDEESVLLDSAGDRRDHSRLSCQIPFTPELDGMELQIIGE